jgi:hypothetical protein
MHARRRFRDSLKRWSWWIVALAVAVASLLFVLITGMRPAYDAYGWLVWGRQALHVNLDTNSAPSWKPLTFLFTFPYALLGRGALFLWMETAVAAALAGAVFAARIAFKLTGPCPQRRVAPYVAGAFAGLGVLGIVGYNHFVLIADSDPMIVTLCLAAIDFHLGRRYRLAWIMFVLGSLGRPEVWAWTALYAVWLWRTHPEMRRWVIGGIVANLLLWFGIPAITSRSWLISGDVASQSAPPVPGNRFTGVLDRFTSLYELPMQIAVLVAMAVAIWQRQRTWLILAGAAALWVAVEIAFAYHGWNASPRYMFEAAAVLIVLAGAGIGRIIALSSSSALVRWAGIAVAVALIATIAPQGRVRLRLLHNGIVLGQNWALHIHRLQHVIAADGGAKSILACGHPVTTIPFQSILAWELGRNVWDVGWDPPSEEKRHRAMILFQPVGTGFVVTPMRIPRADRARCDRLARSTKFNAIKGDKFDVKLPG